MTSIEGVGYVVCVAAFAGMLSLPGVAQTPPPGLPRLQVPPGARGGPPQQATGTGVIRGRVTRLDSGQPLRRVQVTLAGAGARPSALTDDNGRFEIRGLAAGAYTLTASKGGFVTLQYGQRRPGEPVRRIDLGEGAVFDDANLALPPGAAIGGRVFDQHGDPVANTTVQVLRRQYVRGRAELVQGAGVPDTTDDRGEFRVYGLSPGTYYVTASAPEPFRERGGTGPPTGAPTFYPGTSSAEAALALTVGPGEEIAGLSFGLVPSRLATISGIVRLPDGGLESQVTIGRVVPGGRFLGLGGFVRPDGSFAYANLPPGEYLVGAGTRAQDLVALARVVLDGSDVSLLLTPRPVAVARGRIAFEAGPTPALQPSQVRVRTVALERLDLPIVVGQPRIHDDWTFEAPVPPGVRLLRATLPAGWAIKRIRAGNTDVTDTPILFDSGEVGNIEILLTNRLTDVSGTVLDRRGQPIADAAVVLFAEDPGRWGPESRFVALVRPDARGRFEHRGLPPARYVAVAVDYLEQGEETNPETLAALQRLGVVFTLDEGGSTTVDLPLTAMP